MPSTPRSRIAIYSLGVISLLKLTWCFLEFNFFNNIFLSIDGKITFNFEIVSSLFKTS